MYKLSEVLSLNSDEKIILKLKEIKSPFSNKTYTFMNYNKKVFTEDTPSNFGLFRSVILDSDNKVVCFSPPKSIDAKKFIQYNPNPKDDFIVCEEFVEGTMINLFWNTHNNSWEIVTKKQFAENVVISKPPVEFDKGYAFKTTFDSIFMDTIKEIGINNIDDVFSKNYCYSFVLQHPKNKIVLTHEKSSVYLIAVYEITDNNVIRVYNYGVPNGIKVPMKYSDFESYSDIIDKYACMNTSYEILGVMIYNKETGDRCKLTNPVYEQIHHLQGTTKKTQWLYFSLRKEGKVGQHLSENPKSKKLFSEFRDQLHVYTRTLFENYLRCYVKKEKELKEFPQQSKFHMFQLHQIYLKEMVETKRYIKHADVVEYVNKLSASQLVYLLNFEFKYND